MKVLFSRHQVRVYLRFALRLVRDEALAEDVISDAFMDPMATGRSLRGESLCRDLAHRHCRNKAWSPLRKRRDAELDEDYASAIEDESDGPEVLLRKQDKGLAIRACLERLSAEHREVIDLVYYHENFRRGGRVIVGIPENTVKTRLFHARKKLGEMLKAAGYRPGLATESKSFGAAGPPEEWRDDRQHRKRSEAPRARRAAALLCQWPDLDADKQRIETALATVRTRRLARDHP